MAAGLSLLHCLDQGGGQQSGEPDNHLGSSHGQGGTIPALAPATTVRPLVSAADKVGATVASIVSTAGLACAALIEAGPWVVTIVVAEAGGTEAKEDDDGGLESRRKINLKTT
ncbi:hypothetical protein E2562_006509 [Oryza meyeriana var. granulata]|uniref:Uncharacterized protein n=1 Tax=Oryza meyeriana var. granulata TaxID=110450 RepID=A0A6G1CP58_9ORYZ|nr:hypothetical protein E2562_006509 [Oryza meyeriana var. granulata]